MKPVGVEDGHFMRAAGWRTLVGGHPIFVAAMCWCAGLLSADQARADAIEVDHAGTVVRYITFDPKNPPADMPKLKPDEDAFTRFDFWIDTQFSYRVDKPGADHIPTATIRSAKVSLTLTIDIYLPTDATAKLKAHEEGHRNITDQTYADADETVRAWLEKVVGTKQKIEKGKDHAKLIKELAAECARNYHSKVTARATRVNDIYDEITAHGRKAIPEANAIAQAFATADK